MESNAHWNTIYSTRQPGELSWYQAHPDRSLNLIDQSGAEPGSAIIDVGGGDSLLVDALLDRGMRSVTVLDISGIALDRAKARLGADARGVTWIEADITKVDLSESAFDIWHDRAAFHFLTEPADRRCYVAMVRRALRSGGALIIATFADDGPSRCSGIDVMRYSPTALAREFGPEFDLIVSGRDVHRTPAWVEQTFSYALFQKR